MPKEFYCVQINENSSIELSEEIIKWCKEQNIWWNNKVEFQYNRYCFRNKNDAVLFKLRFG